MCDDDVNFPELPRCAKRLGLDEHAMAESLLVRLDNGESFWGALRGVITEAAERKGILTAEVQRQIDAGDIFFEAPRPEPPATLGRLVEALESEHVDFLDALAAAGAIRARRGDFSEHRRGRAERLATIAADEEERP